jgi:cytochrome P450 family 6
MPESNVKVPVGQLVAISVQGIHHDERYYTDPEKFDPERFTPENKASRPTYSYLPFGMGPRNCIGKLQRFMCNLLSILDLIVRTERYLS